MILIFTVQYAYALEDELQTEKLQAADFRPKVYAFDSRSLFGGSSKDIDLSQFTNQDAIATGIYSLNTSINHERSLGQLSLKFERLDLNQDVVLCIDESLLQQLDLRQDVLKKLPKQSCLTIQHISPNATYDLDFANLNLNISLPLAIINQRPRGYIAPERFDQGVTSAYVGYDFNTYTSTQERADSVTQNYMSLTGGLNLGAFNYRHTGSFSSSGQGLGQYSSYLNTLSTDILALKGRLTAGDFSTTGNYIDSAQIVGLQFSSDTSMRPFSQRGYVPVIQGFANTNALVSVFQNGQKIYERNVPAGAFDFNDLNAIGNHGDLTVEVTETGGEKHRYIIPMQSNMSLVRVGQLNYHIAAGQYKINQQKTDEYLSQFGFEYGLNNYLSLYAGMNHSSPFQSYLLGLSANTFLGGIRLDAEHANSTLLAQDYVGEKYKLAYRYFFEKSNTSLNISAQHQSREYMTLGNSMSLLNYEKLSQAEIDNLFQTYRLRHQWNVSLYQSLAKSNWGTLSFNTASYRYWNSSKDYQHYNFAYANRWNRLMYSIGYMYLENYMNDHKEKRVYLSLSLPLDWSRKRASINSSIQHSNSSGHPTTVNTGLTGTFGDYHQFGYNLSTNQSWDQNTNSSAISAGMNYHLPQVQLGVVAGWSDQYSQYGLNARGAFVAHPYGITATNNISDTFTIIHAEDAKGANVINASGVKVDGFGNAIYSGVSPYDVNTISLDTKNLPVDVQISSNQAEVIPRRYSSTLLKFETKKVSNILLDVKVADGTQIPIGIQAKDLNGQVVGMFGQSNQLFVENSDLLQHEIEVKWGVAEVKSCRIDASHVLLKNQKNKNLFQVINVECK